MPSNQLTHDEKVARNSFITEAAARHPGNFQAAIREGVAAFRAHRTTLAAVTETTAHGVPKPGKRARRIARAVSEAMVAAQAPQPAPAAAPSPAAKAPAAGTPMHEMTADQFAAASAQQLGAACRSPFWRPQESSPGAPVTETAATAPGPNVPLHTLTADALSAHAAATFAAHGREAGFRSPGWQG